MKKLLIIVAVLYVFFTAISLAVLYYLERRIKRRKKNIIGKGSQLPEQESLKADIIGKSKFSLSNSLPEATSTIETEKTIQNPDTFAATSEEKSSIKVPIEEIDEAFSDSATNEDNEPMDISYPLDYYSDEESDEEESEEVAGTAQAALATGVQFDDLGNAVRTVIRTEQATKEQREAAGNTLLEIRKTDMFEQLVSGKPDRRKVVSVLIAERLSAFFQQQDQDTNGKLAPVGFDIRDFV